MTQRTEPMLTPQDDLPGHQTPGTFAQAGNDDLRFTERWWYTAHPTDGRPLLIDVGFGYYPNRGVMDAFAGVTVGRRQHNFRASHRLGCASHADPQEFLLDLVHVADGVPGRVPVPEGAGTGPALLPVGRRVPAPGRWRGVAPRDHRGRPRSPVGRRSLGPDPGRRRTAPVLRPWRAARAAAGAAAHALLPQRRPVRRFWRLEPR